MKELKKTYKAEIYSNYRIHVVITDDIEKSAHTHCKIEIKECGGLFIGGIPSKAGQGWIFLDPNTPTSTIAHESFHAAYRLLSDVGCELDKESEEPYAYLIGWITNKCVIALQAWEKKYPEEDSAYKINNN